MTSRIPRIAARFAMTLAMVAAATMPVLAEDGVIEINQAKINASGFPIFSITTSGSYKLTSNITVTTAATEAISIGASQVTLDLNGFTISGSGIATADIFEQSGTTQFVLKNGTIVGNANTDCVQLASGDTSTIDHVTFSGCAGGIAIGANSRVTTASLPCRQALPRESIARAAAAWWKTTSSSRRTDHSWCFFTIAPACMEKT